MGTYTVLLAAEATSPQLITTHFPLFKLPMPNPELEQRILQFVLRKNYQPIKARMIAQRMGFSKDETVEVRRTIKRMIRRGQLAYGAKHLVKPPGAAAAKGPSVAGQRVVGVFQRTSKGFGFVRPKEPFVETLATKLAEEPTGKPADIYIPAKRAGDASTGDVVLVQLGKSRGGMPGPRGEIVEIIERQTNQFVGTYIELDGSGYVQVDGTLFAQPILVGDPGAKGAQLDDKVVIEMIRFPSPIRDGEGVITKVLGPRGEPGVDTQSIIHEYNLADEFPEDVLEDARRQAEFFTEAIPEGRVDLTGETILTIDPKDARDFDDAISLERLDNGHWRLGVHIADVAHFVQPKTALDREAHGRATSVYLPDRVLPMLPEIISNSLASLQPDKTRYTKTAFIEFTEQGQRVAVDLCRAAIRSSKRLNYEQVDEFLADPVPWRKKLGAKVHDLLGRMHELAMLLRRRRMANGSLQLDMPEVKVDLDGDGRVAGAHVVENTESHQIIEEFMLAANEAVAETLREKEIPFLRRIHESPEPRKMKVLTEFVTELGYKVGNLEDRFELQRLLDMVQDKPERFAVNFATLRSLQRAVYSPEEEGHYALASECYCHFTSPIRRYPDLTVHRLVDAILDQRQPKQHLDELVVLGDHCSDREKRAEAAERDLTKLKLLHYLAGRIGEEMDAVVTGVDSVGLFVQGIDLPAEGLVHADSLVDDFYSYDRPMHALVGRREGNVYRLGDRVRVVVARVDLDRRQLDLRLARLSDGRSRSGTRGAKTKKGQRETGQRKAKTSRKTSSRVGGRKKKKSGTKSRRR